VAASRAGWLGRSLAAREHWFLRENDIMGTRNNNPNRNRLTNLVRRAQQRDMEAFGELFELYDRAVFAVALRRLGDFDEAEELRQEVFLQAMQKIGQLREPACVGGWLRSITIRLSINFRVRRRPATATEPLDMEAHCVERRTPADAAVQAEESAQIRGGLGRLRELDRTTLEAFYMHGRSLLEMSDQFAAPLGTIKRRLHVARKRLAREVEPLAV
jgi:RNA polymerase sigma-70 factor (ECF subfamily)